MKRENYNKFWPRLKLRWPAKVAVILLLVAVSANAGDFRVHCKNLGRKALIAHCFFYLFKSSGRVEIEPSEHWMFYQSHNMLSKYDPIGHLATCYFETAESVARGCLHQIVFQVDKSPGDYSEIYFNVDDFNIKLGGDVSQVKKFETQMSLLQPCKPRV